MCLATHNFFKDPPFGKNRFSKLSQCADIYGTLFAKKSDDHVSLCVKSKRILLLGKSETTGGVQIFCFD
jgi:hypothetical protein